jgi:hypothetical protein
MGYIEYEKYSEVVNLSADMYLELCKKDNEIRALKKELNEVKRKKNEVVCKINKDMIVKSGGFSITFLLN